MVLKRRAVEQLAFLASSTPSEGGFSVEQQGLLNRLPTALKMLHLRDGVSFDNAPVACQGLCRGLRRQIFFVRQRHLGAVRQTVTFPNIFASMRSWLRHLTARYDEVITKLQSSLRSVVMSTQLGQRFGSFKFFQRLRLNGSRVRNFSSIGNWLWFSTQDDDGQVVQALGCLRVVLRLQHTVVVIIQSALCEQLASSIADFSARRVQLQDSFRLIVNPQVHASFRTASVHHDCVRTAQQGVGRCGMQPNRAGSPKFHHFNDTNYFVNPAWHSVNRL